MVVPTRAGPAGAVVSEPEGERRGALVLLQGLGPPARAGVNAVWTRIARDLAGLGFVVLRFDFACEGDSTLAGSDVERDIGWRRSTDLAMLRDIAPWFLERAGERELLLVGSCHGARVALEYAAFEPAARGLFLITPYFWEREPHLGKVAGEDDPPDLEPVEAGGPVLSTDADILDGLRAALGRGPVWVLVGEDEEEVGHVSPFHRQLGETGSTFELEIAPGMPLHPGGHPHQQAAMRQRVPARLAEMAAATSR